MKTVLLLITLFFSFMALTGCTNDEGENDIDIITPNEDDETSLPKENKQKVRHLH